MGKEQLPALEGEKGDVTDWTVSNFSSILRCLD